jgi:hypothetical protein
VLVRKLGSLMAVAVLAIVTAACTGVGSGSSSGANSSAGSVCSQDNGYSAASIGLTIPHSAQPTAAQMKQIHSTPALAGLKARQLKVVAAYAITGKAPATLEVLSLNGAKGQLAPDTLRNAATFIRLHIANSPLITVNFTKPNKSSLQYCDAVLPGMEYVIITPDRSLPSAMAGSASEAASYIGEKQHFSIALMAARGTDTPFNLTGAGMSVMCEATLRINLASPKGLTSSQLLLAIGWGRQVICQSFGTAVVAKDVSHASASAYRASASGSVMPDVLGQPEPRILSDSDYSALP